MFIHIVVNLLILFTEHVQIVAQLRTVTTQSRICEERPAQEGKLAKALYIAVIFA